MNKVLQMLFKTDNRSSTTISIPDPEASLNKETIRSAMQTIIEKNIFDTLNEELVSPVNAKVVAVLLELGFITNDMDRRLLLDRKMEFAIAVVSELKEYL